ncbi:hypothetical protein VQ7734_01981 [Vibrio quintilis]|uniref:Uncharacterized protein n=1 Tax=Vibrio quintilis TaxID=1117707 RepID=A0A1M7YUD1_9VIBR|nr:hypothetical protein VQ7734_01981 [Vibrio quintilis]
MDLNLVQIHARKLFHPAFDVIRQAGGVFFLLFDGLVCFCFEAVHGTLLTLEASPS